MADFVVRIPRVSVAISEAELVDLLVADGAPVTEGEPLFVIATDKVESEILAGGTGVVRWSGSIGTVYEIGEEIGKIEATG
ncbi:dihydrolipoamide acyltransferase [Parafrankia colletiae]|uniref:Dihydrolipoamide acyltransferase n=1 Tax=Parafrankia colletiae TaxID=573497 RepID=A0A1S1RAE0_9ACTN|nr:biotin/lipoyl-containing protein [Parafrankia colletiae]MCK9900522.1 dihydrolipoamide acyltransferase [Frankia sp. Cpl3]OHV43150.1 dihydrolipoamide acyltransferase [Parafrankia colletiae]